jgi:hypothetical protein
LKKLEFADAKRNLGYVKAEDGKFSWHYDGSFDQINEIITRFIGMEVHGGDPNNNGDIQADGLSEMSPEEIVNKISGKFVSEPTVSSMSFDGEQFD